MEVSYINVECILDEGSKSVYAKLPGQLRVGEATKFLIDRYKSGDPDASQYGLVIQRDMGGPNIPSDPSKTLNSLIKNVCKQYLFYMNHESHPTAKRYSENGVLFTYVFHKLDVLFCCIFPLK